MNIRDQLLNILSSGPITLNEIYAQSNYSRSHTHNTLLALRDEGKITVSHYGRFTKYALYKVDKGKYPPKISDVKAIDIACKDSLFAEMPMKQVYKTLAEMDTRVYRRWDDGSITWLS